MRGALYCSGTLGILPIPPRLRSGFSLQGRMITRDVESVSAVHGAIGSLIVVGLLAPEQAPGRHAPINRSQWPAQ
jgi:hypothetical protein